MTACFISFNHMNRYQQRYLWGAGAEYQNLVQFLSSIQQFSWSKICLFMKYFFTDAGLKDQDPQALRWVAKCGTLSS